MAKFLLVDFRLIIPRIKPTKVTRGNKKTTFKIGDGAIGFIPKNKNNSGIEAIIILIIPKIRETIALPLGLVFLV
jgi:hypothetical protein